MRAHGDALRNVAQVLASEERNANEIVLRLDLFRTHSGGVERLAIMRRVLVGMTDHALQSLSLSLLQLRARDALLLV